MYRSFVEGTGETGGTDETGNGVCCLIVQALREPWRLPSIKGTAKISQRVTAHRLSFTGNKLPYGNKQLPYPDKPNEFPHRKERLQ